MHYDFKALEAKWQKYWRQNKIFQANNQSEKPKYYVLDMFPYPSGAGLHVGHPLGYIASDIYARYKRLQGFEVLHPQGYDSFGLPAEQYAIQTGQHPAVTTKENCARYREQLDKMGFSFDWNRQIKTSDPTYYKWTQWIFLQLFDSWYDNSANKARNISQLIEIFEKNGNALVDAACNENSSKFSAADWKDFTQKQQQIILLDYRLAYLADTEVNWCPELGTVLANDEIINGVSERGGHPVVRKKMKQWSMRITAYAQRLLDGLQDIDWSQSIKDTQSNWIGRSEGAMVHFGVKDLSAEELSIAVFTTRPDTIFGVSFLTLAPEHDLVSKITTPQYRQQVTDYIQATTKRSERDRLADTHSISGVFTGAYAVHPFTYKQIPIWIGDYVLASYGTGAVMAVPCGDQRDHDFARHFDLPIPTIFKDIDCTEHAFTDKHNCVIANSDFLNGLTPILAKQRILEALERTNTGKRKVNYRLRDAVFSRQRYWGEPFPIYYRENIPQPIAPKFLPLELPKIEKYLPTDTGEPPLGRATHWAWDIEKNCVVSNQTIDNQIVFPLELNTMPGWAGSSFYFNRYMDPQNEKELVSEQALHYWKNIDLYMGGSEHATGHLLYARFWQHFLFDKGIVSEKEFAKKMINQGMILGESAFVFRVSGTNTFVSNGLQDNQKTEKIRIPIRFVNPNNEVDLEGIKNHSPQFKNAKFKLKNGKYIAGREVEKMSKSKFNVINPDDICDAYGADTLRLYEMFLGPLEQAKPWNTAGITGVHGFLKKLWRLFHHNESFVVSEDNLDNKSYENSLKILHKTIKKVTEDIESFSFNTAVSAFMIAVNELTAQQCNHRSILEPLLILLSPFAPHIAEELWSKLGNRGSISTAIFPKHDPTFTRDSTKVYPVSFNGKTRFTLELSLALDKERITQEVLDFAKTKAQLKGRTPKKIIVIPGKIVNIVV